MSEDRPNTEPFDEEVGMMEKQVFEEYMKDGGYNPSSAVKTAVFLSMRTSYLFKQLVLSRLEAKHSFALAEARGSRLEQVLDFVHRIPGKTRELGLDQSIKEALDYISKLRIEFVRLSSQVNPGELGLVDKP